MGLFGRSRQQRPASGGYLEGQVLIAMPNMPDPKFEQAVLFLCAHSERGAMGLVLNKLVNNITFMDLLRQLRIRPQTRSVPGVAVQFGGPVETGRGFVLHSPEYSAGETTAKVGQNVGLTATVDVLKAMAEGNGPRNAMLALGYAGWGTGQLESEIQHNGWLTCPADDYLLFGQQLQGKWDYAIRKLGFNPSQLSRDSGRA
ncbi:MAG: YqgE/AlgH family protein [Alphaproteobacteria bacterium]|nr:YqgE/AlgH family protein [Alphaproteobacteria bacterium]